MSGSSRSVHRELAARTDQSVAEVIARLTKAHPKLTSTSRTGLALAVIVDYPRPALTTVVTIGLSARQRSRWRGLPVGFELLAVAPEPVGVLGDRLAEAAIADLVDPAPHLIHDRMPPRGIMVNGAYQALSAPHLVFSADGLPSGFERKVRAGGRWIEFLRALPVTDAQLDAYDAAPGATVASIATRLSAH